MLTIAACGADDRTVETIPIPESVDGCLDELQAPSEPVSLFGTEAADVRLCAILQGLDCVLIEPLCTDGPDCPTPAWSCANPGLELEAGDVLDAHLFIVDNVDPMAACDEVSFGDPPTCVGPNCLARVEYEVEYTGGDDDPLRVSSSPVRIFHSGYLSEQVGSFTSEPTSICSAITDFTCEGGGCDAPTRLDINVGGVGGGRVDVVSEIRNFTCEESRCTVFLPSGRTADLTATPTTGVVFGDWGDACASQGRTPQCSLQPTGETVVTARFGHRLEIEVLGRGAVRSTDGGIDGTGVDCSSDPPGATCEEDYVSDRTVDLTAIGSAEWPFSGWEGCDDVSGEVCTVLVDRARQVRATFGRQLSVNVTGGGTVTVSPGELVCSDSCAYAFIPGENVSVRATADGGSTRFDWGVSGDCVDETTAVCDLGPIDRNLTVTARFGYDITTIFDASRGTVNRTESEASIPCGSGDGGCRSYLPGTAVDYTAVPLADPAYAFTGWAGLCAARMDNPACSVNVGAPGTVTANFDRAVEIAVDIVNEGSAAGSVVRLPEPNARNCTADCTERYLQSTGTVELIANNPAGTRFIGWTLVGGGSPCAGSASDPTCEVDLSTGGDRTVRATFISQQQIAVNLVGEGSGTVNASPGALSCSGNRCTGDFDSGETVTITAQTSGPNHLEGFSSSDAPSCNGATCTVTVDDFDVAIDAEIEVERTLELDIAGNTGGSVVLPPSFEETASLTCTSDCSRVYLSGRQFTLVAERPNNVVFDGWGGCNGGSGTSCQVVMDASPKRLTATFLPPRRLTVDLAGTGNARVDVSGAGNPSVCSGVAPLSCPELNFPSGTQVTLTVPALTGTDFGGWSGDCAGATGTVCTLQMTRDRSATATFAQRTHDVMVVFGGAAAGSGVVAWITPSRNDCTGPSSCTETVDEGTAVALRPIGGTGYQFDRWVGCDQVVSGDECRLNNVTANRSVTADFIPLNGVQVVLQGSGTGRILWRAPSRPTCERSVPATCPVEQVAQGGAVELDAEAANTDTEFVAWTSCPNANNARCTISSVSGPVTVNAEFVALHDVAVTLAGDGDGRVEWTSPGFPDCVPGTCPPRQVREGTAVTLTAETVAGSTFTGWTGCDTTNGNVCELTSVDRDRNPTASYFDDRTVTVRLRGTGMAGMDYSVGGSVVASCPESPVPYDCTQTFAYTAGTVVLMPAITSTTTTFTGWGSGCTGTGTCLVDIQTAATHAREANFN